ncbi:hypothetical protein [Massilia sp. S19_KUP03_FR1]|uniref:hypothetical protein n=1 Tax=Massilia sp. S19_KUP03_FR1 TaxID=3025503 RepID=UPI002FCCCB95
MTPAGRALAVAVVLASVALAPWPATAAMPSTFGPVIGNAILCRSHLENNYFYNYLDTAFGKSYKHEGGAYWFKTPDTTLWGAEVKEVWVSDDTSELISIGALTESEPDKLADAVKSAVGLRYPVQGADKYPLRVSALGSTIAYVNKKSKIYCARYKPLPTG